MQSPIRPRRSMLYIPGANARALEKARGLPADVLVFDLEDAVLPEKKAEAREIVRSAVAAGGYGTRELILRVNGVDTEWGEDDLRFAAGLGVDGVLLPKIDAPETIRQAAMLVDKPLWAMMETPAAILRAAEIAAAGLAGLVMGLNDLAKELRARQTPGRLPFAFALGQCVAAARASGIAAMDGVHLDLEDEPGFEAACIQGRDFGFDGKSLLHPKQIEAANRLFGPSGDEVEQARRIIAGFEAAQAEGKGVVLVGGKMVEMLHVEEARRLIALAQAIDRPAQ